MVKVFQGTDKEYYMDGYLKSNLDIAKKVIKKDWDMIFVVDGYEGVGKSILAMQIAYYCDPTLDLSRIVSNPEDFKVAVMSTKPYQAVVFDEAYGGLSSRGAMGRVNRALVQMLTTIRQKNLFIFIVLPSFMDLDRYVALWRSRCLIHTYSDAGFKRGFFSFYDMDRKKGLYVYGKKFYDYSKPRAAFRGRFTNHYVVDADAYKDKKVKTSIRVEDMANSPVRVGKEILGTIINNLNDMPDLTMAQKTNILSLSRQTIWRYTKEYDNNGQSPRDLPLRNT